jgi:hypothetical protein
MRFFLFFFCLLSLQTYSQKEHSKWCFGSKATLDFLSGTPVAVANSSINSLEGCMSLADSSGNLLFYTDGVSVWNKNHAIMDNGNGLMGHSSTTQSSFVVKKPGQNSSIYYLFTLGQLGTGCLGYSVIDMSLAAGLGSVTVKNDTLATTMTEKLHGTLHCNGTDVWVVGHKYNSNAFYAYLVSAVGVNPAPVISSIGLMHGPNTGSVSSSIGTLKIAPNGKKISLVIADPKSVELFDFNPSSGQVTNALVISTNFTAEVYGCEFSPDCSKLYVTESYNPTAQLYQYDLCAGTSSAIINSGQLIASVSNSLTGGLFAAQIAPDSKIYVASINANSINVIANPNTAGLACNFLHLGVSLGSGISGSYRGLPNFMSSAYRQKTQIHAAAVGSCGAVTFSFAPPPYLCAQASDSVSTVLWHFNDPQSGAANTSSLVSPQHHYSQNGNYSVTLIVHYTCYTDTLKQTVNINDIPNLVVAGKQTICKGEKAGFTLSGAATYSLNGLSCQNTFTVQPVSNTVYTLSGAGSGTNACMVNKTITLSVLPCTSILKINQENIFIRIYPNPTNGIVTLETESKTEIHITDLCGRIVYFKTLIPGLTNIDLNEQPNGLYFVKTKNESGMNTFKLIKSNLD